jgi:mRNA interferase RelE/StbE
VKTYSIIFSSSAAKQVGKLPANIKSRIDNVLCNVLAVNPFEGKALKADLSGLYSYRVGAYRIIYKIVKDRLVIQIIKVMHRREVYR